MNLITLIGTVALLSGRLVANLPTSQEARRRSTAGLEEVVAGIPESVEAIDRFDRWLARSRERSPFY